MEPNLLLLYQIVVPCQGACDMMLLGVPNMSYGTIALSPNNHTRASAV
jgi:hypothetical protein